MSIGDTGACAGMRAAPAAAPPNGWNAFRPHRLLQHQHVMTHGAPIGVRPVGQVLDERADVAAADVHVPADERDLFDADRGGAVAAGVAVNRGVRPACAPCVEPRALARIIWRKPLKLLPIGTSRRKRV